MIKIFVLLFLLTSCAHSIHEVHVGDFSPTQKPISSGKWISAEATQNVVFWFSSETNYVNEARKKLIAQCPHGNIQGVTTRYSTSLGFFNWDNKIFMQGLCL